MGTVFNKKELLVLLQDFHCLTGRAPPFLIRMESKCLPIRRNCQLIAA